MSLLRRIGRLLGTKYASECETGYDVFLNGKLIDDTFAVNLRFGAAYGFARNERGGFIIRRGGRLKIIVYLGAISMEEKP